MFILAASLFLQVELAVADGTRTTSSDKQNESLYLVVDLSGGTSATSYPVSSLPTKPMRGWTDIYKTDKLVLRRIEAGSFMMGSPEDELGRNALDEDLHKVTLTKSYYIW